MGIEYATILGYGMVSLILIIAASVFATDNKRLFPLRVLLFLIGLFLILKIPSTLNHFVYANDVVNEGLLNSTQVADLIRSNNTYSTTLVRLPYIVLAYMFIYLWFFWFKDEAEKVWRAESKQFKNFESKSKGDLGKKWR